LTLLHFCKVWRPWFILWIYWCGREMDDYKNNYFKHCI